MQASCASRVSLASVSSFRACATAVCASKDPSARLKGAPLSLANATQGQKPGPVVDVSWRNWSVGLQLTMSTLPTRAVLGLTPAPRCAPGGPLLLAYPMPVALPMPDSQPACWPPE